MYLFNTTVILNLALNSVKPKYRNKGQSTDVYYLQNSNSDNGHRSIAKSEYRWYL